MAAAMCWIKNLTFCRFRDMRMLLIQSRMKSGKIDDKNKQMQSPKVSSKLPRKEKIDRVADTAYNNMTNERLKEADRSLLLKLSSHHKDNIISVLLRVEKKIGPIEQGFLYKNYAQNDLLLVEFSSEDLLKKYAQSRVLSTSRIKKVVPRMENEDLLEKISIYEPKPFKPQSLHSCSSIGTQMLRLYEKRKMSEAVCRLQFFICMLLYRVIKENFSEVQVLPFGSWSCCLAIDGASDVDVSIMHNYNHDILREVSKQFRKHDLFDEIVFLSGARVPIIKMKQRHSQVSCDICSNGFSGVMMSKVLHQMGEMESSFFPMVLTVKILAKEFSLSASGLSHKFSSFMLTMMVLSYFQHEGTLPAMKAVLKNQTVIAPQRLDFENLFASKALGDLLIGFFKYYSTFPFISHIMDPYYGKIVIVPHAYAACIINPFELGHNICKNVKHKEVENFQLYCKEFAKVLELNSKERNNDSSWGLEKLLSMRGKKFNLRLDIHSLLHEESDFIEEVTVDMDGDNDSVRIDHKEKTLIDDCVSENAADVRLSFDDLMTDKTAGAKDQNECVDLDEIFNTWSSIETNIPNTSDENGSMDKTYAKSETPKQSNKNMQTRDKSSKRTNKESNKDFKKRGRERR